MTNNKKRTIENSTLTITYIIIFLLIAKRALETQKITIEFEEFVSAVLVMVVLFVYALFVKLIIITLRFFYLNIKKARCNFSELMEEFFEYYKNKTKLGKIKIVLSILGWLVNIIGFIFLL